MTPLRFAHTQADLNECGVYVYRLPYVEATILELLRYKLVLLTQTSYSALHVERHRSRRIFHTKRHIGMTHICTLFKVEY